MGWLNPFNAWNEQLNKLAICRVFATLTLAGMANGICTRIGRRLRVLRTKRDWSQQCLAEISGVNRLHISEIKNGKRAPRVCLLDMPATCFKMTVSDF
jgi:DNA-binding XRE family transcriptional regulator